MQLLGHIVEIDGQYPADRLRLVISYLKIYAAALVQMFAALQRQNPVKIQTVPPLLK